MNPPDCEELCKKKKKINKKMKMKRSLWFSSGWFKVLRRLWDSNKVNTITIFFVSLEPTLPLLLILFYFVSFFVFSSTTHLVFFSIDCSSIFFLSTAHLFFSSSSTFSLHLLPVSLVLGTSVPPVCQQFMSQVFSCTYCTTVSSGFGTTHFMAWGPQSHKIVKG